MVKRREERLEKKEEQETNQVLREGEMISEYVKSNGWQWAKNKLTEKVMDLQSIMNVEGKPDEIIIDLKARKMAIGILIDWLKTVEGRAEQHEANKNLANVYKEEIVIYQ